MWFRPTRDFLCKCGLTHGLLYLHRVGHGWPILFHTMTEKLNWWQKLSFHLHLWIPSPLKIWFIPGRNEIHCYVVIFHQVICFYFLICWKCDILKKMKKCPTYRPRLRAMLLEPHICLAWRPIFNMVFCFLVITMFTILYNVDISCTVYWWKNFLRPRCPRFYWWKIIFCILDLTLSVNKSQWSSPDFCIVTSRAYNCRVHINREGESSNYTLFYKKVSYASNTRLFFKFQHVLVQKIS